MIGPGGEPRVSVVIVTFHSVKELPACVDSLDRQGVPLEVFLVDNASGDATPDLARRYGAEYNNVHPILNETNHGLAYANNQALGRMKGDHVLLLNPDTTLQDGALAELVGSLDRRPEVVIVGPRNVFADGRSHMSYLRTWSLWHVFALRLLPNRWSRRVYDRLARYRTCEVQVISGSCLLIRREVFEGIGGYDPQFFLAVDDVADLCRRAASSGGKVMFLGGPVVMHLGGRSGSVLPFLVAWEDLRGSVYYFGKHHGTAAGILVTSLYLAKQLLWGMVSLLPGIVSSRWREKSRRHLRLMWKLLSESPLQSRHLHRFPERDGARS